MVLKRENRRRGEILSRVPGQKKQPVLFLVLMVSLLNGCYQLSVPWLSLQDFFLCLLGGPYHLSAWWFFLLNRSSNVWYASTLNSQQKQQLYIWKQEGQLTVDGTLTASIWTQLFLGEKFNIFSFLFFLFNICFCFPCCLVRIRNQHVYIYFSFTRLKIH